jgi:UDPglucose 6-dehydrogenase
VAKLQRHLGDLAGKRIAVLGLAFKPNTDDMRGASSLVLAARLAAEGAHVRAYDPIAEEEAKKVMPELDCAESVFDVVSDADAVVLVTEWPEFLALDWDEVAARMSGKLVIDGRNALDPVVLDAAGLTYEGIGRP